MWLYSVPSMLPLRIQTAEFPQLRILACIIMLLHDYF